MFYCLICILLITNKIKSIDCFNSSITKIELLISSDKREYLVKDIFTILVRSNVAFNDENLVIRLEIKTRVPINEFIECLNCNSLKRFSSSSVNIFKISIKKPCEIKFSPRLYLASNDTLTEYNKDSSTNLPIKRSFLSLNIIKSAFLYRVIEIIGWLNFLFLICSFYPQIIENFLSKDTSGLNVDYIMITTIGFISYSIVNLALFFSEELKIEFFLRLPLQDLPELNEVILACHQIAMAIILIIQALVYSSNQQLSSCGLAYLVASFSPMVVLIVLVVLKQIRLIDYIQFLNFARFISLSVRFIPQIVYNYNRCSTSGFSRNYIYLDFLGNLFFIVKIVLMMINFDDFGLLFKVYNNLTNFSQSIFSIFFDFVLLSQHFCCLYSNPSFID